MQAVFFYGMFYLCLHFPVFLTNLYVKVIIATRKLIFILGFSEPTMPAIIVKNNKNQNLTVNFGAYIVRV